MFSKILSKMHDFDTSGDRRPQILISVRKKKCFGHISGTIYSHAVSLRPVILIFFALSRHSHDKSIQALRAEIASRKKFCRGGKFEQILELDQISDFGPIWFKFDGKWSKLCFETSRRWILTSRIRFWARNWPIPKIFGRYVTPPPTPPPAPPPCNGGYRSV